MGLDDSSWKARFRVPLIRAMQLAPHAPGRGLISSNSSGVFQLYAWEIASGRLRQLTTRKSGVNAGLLSSDGRWVYYHDDVEGNEVGHLVRVSFDGASTENVTPAMVPYPICGFAGSAAGNRLGFVTAGQGNYELYVVDVDAGGELGSPRRLSRSPRMMLAPVLSQDGAIVVVACSKDVHSLRCSLVAVNAVTGDVLGSVEDVDGHMCLGAFSPLPGDARMVGSSNRTGVERPFIWDISRGSRTDLATGGLEGDMQPVDWDHDGSRLLMVQFSRAVQQLHMYDLSTMAWQRLQHPSGSYTEICMAPDASVHAVWEDSTNAPQVIAIDSANGRVSRLLSLVSNPIRCRPWRSVSFRSSDGEQIQGWLAVPDGAGPFPAILHLHGGPEFAMSDVFFAPSQMWLDHGFAFMSINYRGSTTFGRAFLEQIWGNIGYWEVEDMVAARSWLIESGIAEPSCVFAVGSSYGGYLTLQALGTTPRLWAGGIAGLAAADWTVIHEDTTDTLRGVRAARFGGTPEEHPERYARSSAITYAEHVAAPVQIIQGRHDTRYPPRSVAMYEQKMRALGKSIEVHWFDAGHGSLVLEQLIEHYELMLQFARRIVGEHRIDSIP